MPDTLRHPGLAAAAAAVTEASSPAVAAWDQLIVAATGWASKERVLRPLLDRAIFRHDGLAPAVGALVADKLATPLLGVDDLVGVFAGQFQRHQGLADTTAQDLFAALDRNPAFPDLLTALLHGKGCHALLTYRLAHSLWQDGRRELALTLSALGNEVFAVDIHPAADIGPGVFIDHGTGVVIGETARVGADTSLLQGVTLGGTGKESGDRHPKVGGGVLIGAGAVILGNIQVGDGAKIGAGSVVLADVPRRMTVVGVPAKPVRRQTEAMPALVMCHDCSERRD